MEKRADRTFHKRVTVAAWCGIVIFACLAFYFFLTKIAILGLLVSIIVVGMVERSIHTTYLFHRVKPIDMEEEMEFLTIDSGRFSGIKNLKTVSPGQFSLYHINCITIFVINIIAVQP